MLTVSAKTPDALRELAGRYEAYLGAHEALSLADVAYTANAGRSACERRLAVIAESAAQARGKLKAHLAGEAVAGVATGRTPAQRKKIAFLFTGQGSQFAGMGRRLYETQPVFREALDRCAAALQGALEHPLLEVLYPAPGAASPIDETRYTQTALFALEYALAQVWKSWGIEPDVALGHSVGEYVAACVAGVFSVEDGLKLIARRAATMQELPAGGKMSAIACGEEQARKALAGYEDRVSIAAVNGPKEVVISGEGAAVEEMLARLEREGVWGQPLRVSHAFHSPLMEPMLAGYERFAEEVKYRRPRIDVISNVTGRKAEQTELQTASYWRRHVREAVRFADGMKALKAEGCEIFVEIGPAAVLTALGRKSVAGDLWLPSLKKGAADWQQMAESLAQLYVNGADVDWRAFDRGCQRRKISLPTYPFQRRRYWASEEPPLPQPRRAASGSAAHPLLGSRVESAGREILFESRVSTQTMPFLADHRVFDLVVLPGAAYMELGMAAGAAAFPSAPHTITDLVLLEALVLEENAARTLQVVISPAEEGPSFGIFSRADKKAFVQHASGKLRPAEAARPAAFSLEDAQARCSQPLETAGVYESARELGLTLGPAFRTFRQVWRGTHEALACLALPEELSADGGGYLVHPCLLDGCLQVVAAAASGTQGSRLFLPFGLDRMELHGRMPFEVWCHARLREQPGADTLVADATLVDVSGRVVAELRGIYAKSASLEALRRSVEPDVRDWMYRPAWELAPVELAEKTPRQWLILGDSGGTGRELAAALEARGNSARVIADVGPENSDIQELSEAGEPCGIVYLADFDEAQGPPDAAATGLLRLVQQLAGAVRVCRLIVVTRGAQSVTGAEAVSFAQTALWGLARVVRLEFPKLGCVCVDLDPDEDTEAAGAGEILQQIYAAGREDEVAWRAGERYAGRLERYRARSAAPAVMLQIRQRGVMDNLELAPVDRRPPAPVEVEIRVAASGLNFRDVLAALAMYPGPAPLLGGEFAGRVVRVGDAVRNLQPGDEVLGLGGGAFGTYVTTPAEWVVRRPDGLSVADAATVPIAFLTACYGLRNLAKIRPGRRVLVHAGAGGVGMTAIRLAQRAGAEVWATAGSEEKRAYLAGLGVRHVMNSRSLTFAAEVLESTDGLGVDVVLNSLSGDFIASSLSVLAQGGCFLEIGKRDVWTAERMAAARPDVAYHCYDILELCTREPAVVREMLEEMRRSLADGSLQPLPWRGFALEQASDAFRYMAQARHIGKIVLTQKEEEAAFGGAWLISGGLGALGLRLAEWLAKQGVRDLVLAGRSDGGDPARRAVEALEKSGVRVRVERLDLTDAAAVEGLVAGIEDLRGVVHAAGVLDDGMMLRQTPEQFARVMAPKAAGAWNLHRATLRRPIEHFVLFSSAAALLGSPGQGNYAAANAFMDGLAHYRRALALPALSIDWGPWSGGGMADEVDESHRRRRRTNGIGTVEPRHGLASLEALLRDPVAQVAVIPVDWEQLLQQFPAGEEPTLLARLKGGKPERLAAHLSASPAPASSGGQLLRAVNAADPDRRGSVMLSLVQGEVVKVLGLDAAAPLDPLHGFFEMGMDSLMAVELKNRLEAGFACSLPPTISFDCPNAEALANYLMGRVAPQEPAATGAADTEDLSDIDNLSEAELAELLAGEIAGLSSGR